MIGPHSPVRAIRRLTDRRPGIIRGRRWALMLAVIAGLVTGPAGPALAGDGSNPLVVATVYSSNGTSTDSVSPAALEANPQRCPTYSGPNTMNELGRQGWVPVQLSGNATWALSTILGCFQTPLPVSAVKGLTVINGDGSPQEDAGAPLTAADLTTPSDFNNTAEQPVVEALGSLNQYDRPWRGAPGGQADYDFLDEVQASQDDQPSPITIEVFEGPLLTVTATASQATVPVGGTVSFSVTVTGANGSALSYSWNFDGGAQSSTAAAPGVQFNAAGRYDVTVQVTDTAGGGGGATVPITVGTPPAPGTGSHNQPGTGTSRKSHAPTGPVKSSGTHAGGKPGKAGSGHSTTAGKGTTSGGGTSTTSSNAPVAPATTTSATRTSHNTSAIAQTTTSTGKPAARAVRARAPQFKPPVTTAANSPLVTGRLISDVIPLPAGASPLIHDGAVPPATAPAARRAVRASLLPASAAGLAVVLLLGLGAGRELRGRRGGRALRFGS